MVSIKQAASQAMLFAQDLLGPQQTQGIRLEEVDGDADWWFVTLSMVATGEILAITTGKRLYKSFTVNKETGEVVSMKIRELADA